MERVIEIEKLTGRDNYHRWRFAAEHALKLQGYWQAILGTETKSDVQEKALSRLVLYISPNLYIHIQGIATAKEMWDKLKSTYDDSGLTRRCGLLRKLTTTHLVNCENISEYVDTIIATAQKLNEIGMVVSDEWVGSLLLSGLPDHFTPMIMAIESSNIEITTDSIKTKLLQDFDNYNNSAGAMTSSDAALYSRQKFTKTKDANKKKNIVCFKCKKEGHMAKNCKSKKFNQAGNSNATTLTAAFNSQYVYNGESWLIDSGATTHMTNNRNCFKNFMEFSMDESVVVANNCSLKALGKGDVVVKLNVDNKMIDATIENVIYVPQICTNLISVSQLVKKGYEIEFTSESCFIRCGERIVATGTLYRDVYQLDLYTARENFAGVTKELLHKRLGHPGYMNKCLEDIFCEQGESKNEKCISCLQGKQTNLRFKSSTSKTNDVLELVHGDVCGPMEEPSMGGGLYFLLFLDDYSHKVFIYILRNKSEVPAKFKTFKEMVENQTNRKIKIFRSDNGLEFCNKDIRQICENSGIVHQTSAPYTPQQNGKAERMNRTIVEKARTMLYDAGLRKCYWAETISTAAYLLNRTPHKMLNEKSPEEVWSGRKQNLSYLKVFGCVAMMMTPKQLRKKWDPRSVKCIMLGYCEFSKAYRLYNPISRKMHVSRNAVFMENEMYFAKNQATVIDNGRLIERSQSLNDGNLVRMILEENSNHSNDDSVIEEPQDNSEYDDEDELLGFTSSEVTEESEEVNEVQTLRRSSRISRPTNMNDFVTYAAIGAIVEPQNFVEAVNCKEREFWKAAITDEINSLIENNTWSIVNCNGNERKLSTKWIFKLKHDEHGNVDRYKARLVARGCAQRSNIDYNETYSPVIRYSSLRYLFSLAVEFNLEINNLDVCTAFLQGDLEEEIFIEAPEGFEIPDGKTLKLNRPIYGLKQSSRMWNLKLSDTLRNLGMTQLKSDQCIYFRIEDDSIFILAIYVDDIIIFWNNEQQKNLLIEKLKNVFKLRDLGSAKSFLGLRIERTNGCLTIDQSAYIQKVLQRFSMTTSNPVSTPMDVNVKLSKEQCPKSEEEKLEMQKYPYQELIGSLLFAAQLTRPDICYAVNFLSRFNNNYGMQHWQAAKRILRYLKGTINYKIIFKNGNLKLEGYCDADYAGDLDGRKSVSGYVFMKQGAPITWTSKKQNTTALSTCEAEYMSMGAAVQEAIWLKGFEEELFGKQTEPIKIFCDNHAATQLAMNESYHPRTKHIDVRHHFIRDCLFNGKVVLEKIASDEMIADLLTKPLVKMKFLKFVNQLGMV